MAETRNRFLLQKIESTYGVSSAPAGTDALLCSDLEIKPLDLSMEERKLLRGHPGNFLEVVTRKMVKITFKVEWAGSGTRGTAPKWGGLMRSCGFSESVVANTSVTYSPLNLSSAAGAVASSTLDFRNDGLKHLATGARGTVSLGMKADDIPQLEFELTAIYGGPTDTTVPALTFANQADPRPVNADDTPTVLVFGYAAQMSEFSLDMGLDVDYRQLAGGSKLVRLADRKPKGEIAIVATSMAEKDFFAPAIAQTLGGISVVHGTTAGNIATVSVPNAALGAPEYDDLNGTQMLKMGYRPIPSAGNDEVTFTLT